MVISIIIIILIILSYGIFPTYGYKIYQKSKKNKSSKIYLTFDDGPSEYTIQLLQLLDKYHISATFFMVANSISKHADTVVKMQKNHVLGLHSFSHKSALLQLVGETKQDFEKSIQITGKYDIHYFRPPWGHFTVATLYQLKKHHLKLILWDVMAEDWEQDTTAKEIADKLKRRVKQGSIICLHDGRGNGAPQRTIEALQEVIPYWIDKGYQFDTVDHYEK